MIDPINMRARSLIAYFNVRCNSCGKHAIPTSIQRTTRNWVTMEKTYFKMYTRKCKSCGLEWEVGSVKGYVQTVRTP